MSGFCFSFILPTKKSSVEHSNSTPSSIIPYRNHAVTYHDELNTSGEQDANCDNEPDEDLKPLVERKEYGVCHILASIWNTKVAQDITPKGAIIHGSTYSSENMQTALKRVPYPLLPPRDIKLEDSRAHQVLVLYSENQWHAIPSTEIFSRYSGSCVILGDRTASAGYAPLHNIELGDCFRIGSVGLVVCEMRSTMDGEIQKLDAKTIQFLKDEASTFKDDTEEDDLATFAQEECDNQINNRNSSRRFSLTNNTSGRFQRTDSKRGLLDGDKFVCYMCYENTDTPDNPLVAPCECKGDTRYLHVNCLQQWYSASVGTQYSQVIRTTGNGAPMCKICGTAYKSTFKRKTDGRITSLLECDGSRPFISLIVFTRHDSDQKLFNSKFRLHFGKLSTTQTRDASTSQNESNEIVIGRSSRCDMILDYRTVSSNHAKIIHKNGKFIIQDNHSSNGTMFYLQRPYPLSYSYPTRLKMGHTTITLQPVRPLKTFLHYYFFSSKPKNKHINGGGRSSKNKAKSKHSIKNANDDGNGGCYLTALEYQKVLMDANMATGSKYRKFQQISKSSNVSCDSFRSLENISNNNNDDTYMFNINSDAEISPISADRSNKNLIRCVSVREGLLPRHQNLRNTISVAAVPILMMPLPSPPNLQATSNERNEFMIKNPLLQLLDHNRTSDMYSSASLSTSSRLSVTSSTSPSYTQSPHPLEDRMSNLAKKAINFIKSPLNTSTYNTEQRLSAIVPY